MAHAAGDSHDIPIYGAHCLLTFPILDADGDLVTAAASLDSEVSKDLGTMTDCTNEATEIATSSGVYYLYLTGAEMTANVVSVIVKTGTAGAKTTVLTLYPKRLPVFESGTAQAGAATTITLASGASSVDNFYNGMFVYISNNGAAGSQYQARKIISYTGSTRVATIESAWGTNPSASSTYDILMPETVRPAGNATYSLVNNAGTTTLTGAVSLGSTLGVTGATTLTGAVSLGSTLGVTGTTTLAAVNTGAISATTLATSGTTTLNALTVTNNLLVSGNSTVTGTTTHTGNVSLAAGLNITQSSSNASALVVTGNGTGHGAIFTSGSGATGDGIKALSAATAGNGMNLLGTTTGSGLLTTGGASNGAAGLKAIGGNGTVCYGIYAGVSNAFSNAICIDGGAGVAANITTTASTALNIATSDGDAVVVTAGNVLGLSVGNGVKITGAAAVGGTPAGHGIKLIGGASIAAGGAVAGNGLYVIGGAGSASVQGAAPGAYFVGGGTNTVASQASGIHAAGTSNGSGVQVVSAGSGSGLLADTISTSGAATFGTFNVTGATNFNGNLQVTGTTTFTGIVTASNVGNNIVGVSAVTLSSAGLDAVLVESGITAGASLTNDASTQLTSINARQALALCTSVLAGVLSGGGTATNTIKQAGKPSGNSRVVATVDSSGNRSALTLKVPT